MWRCASCGESIEAQFDSCWKCGSVRPGGTNANSREPAQPDVANGATLPDASDLIEELSKPLDPRSGPSVFFILLLIAGIGLFAFGLVRFNSIASQIIRAGRDQDALGIVLLFAGVSLAIIGSLGVFGGSHSTVSKSNDSVQNNGLGENAEIVQLLERLASLKERGLLTDEEFQRQKQTILSRQ